MANGIGIRKATENYLIIFPQYFMMMAGQFNGPEYGRPFIGAGVLRISRSARFREGNLHTLATWNIRSIYEPAKIHKMNRLHISALGISEMRQPDSGRTGIIYFVGDKDTKNRNGVAIMLNKVTAKSVSSVVLFSARVMMVQLKTNKINMNVLQVYAPSCNLKDEEVESLYHQIEKVPKLTKSNEITIIIGDMNAKIGKGKEGSIIGDHSL